MSLPWDAAIWYLGAFPVKDYVLDFATHWKQDCTKFYLETPNSWEQVIDLQEGLMHCLSLKSWCPFRLWTTQTWRVVLCKRKGFTMWFLGNSFDPMSSWLLWITWKKPLVKCWLYYLVLAEGTSIAQYEKESKTLISHSFSEFMSVGCKLEVWPLRNILKELLWWIWLLSVPWQRCHVCFML